VPEPSSSTDFVGRLGELAAFDKAADAARRGRPGVVLVGGDAGIGKSTLVVEATRRAGARLFVGRCVPMGGDVIPLAPLAELLRTVRRSTPETLAGPTLARLRDWAAPEAGPGGLTASGLFGPVLELVGSLPGDGVAVVTFEDLHWADPLTWDLFDFLARNMADERVVLVGTYRANEVSASAQQRRRLGELTRLPAVRRIHLGGLGRGEVAARIEALTGRPAPFTLVEEVLTRGQGNPFFTTELVQAHLAGQAIPAVLSDLIAADLADLDETERRVLGFIAAIGRDADHDFLAWVAEVDDDRLEAALRAAIDAQLLVVDPETDAYRFRHTLIGEVVYAELLPPQRRRIHRRIADTMREQEPHRLSRADRASELAVHLDRAGDQPAAFTALLAAADAAETVAPGAALRHLERAFELWDGAGVAAAGVSLSDRLWQAAELASGAASNERAAALARDAIGHGPPPQGVAWGHALLGRYLWAAGHLEQSAAEFEAAAALLPADAGPGMAVVYAGLGQAELMLGRYDSAEARARRVFELLPTPAADPAVWAMARRVLGIVTDYRGDPDDGVELCRDAVATAPSALTRALAVLYLGVALLDAGGYQDAVNEMLDAAADAHLTGLDRSFGGYLDALAAEGLIRLGRWAEADTVLGRSEGADTLPVGMIRLARSGAMLAARRGDRDRALMLLTQAEAQPVDPFHRSFLDEAETDAHLICGEWAAAASIAERALRDDPSRVSVWQARFVMFDVIARVELALDARARLDTVDEETTKAQLRGAVAAAHDDGGASADSAAHLAHAAAALTRLGAPDPDAWAEAAERWERLGDPLWTATARLHEAEAAVASGETARGAEALHRAHELAVHLGAVALLAEVEAVSRRTRLGVKAPAPRVLAAATIDHLRLTPREAEVLGLVAAGQTNREIGERLYVSEKTASVHVSNILRKLGVSSRVDAAAVAQRLGVT
jgi:DNA-binding NarL/FixJ family response regulator